MRRLGAGRIAAGLLDRIPRSLIAWDNVAPLARSQPRRRSSSRFREHRLARLHPSDLAEIIRDLSAHDAARVVDSLDDETAADALEHLDAETQRSIIDDLGTSAPPTSSRRWTPTTPPTSSANCRKTARANCSPRWTPKRPTNCAIWSQYDEDTAGGLMTTDYVWIYPHRTVSATIAKIRELAPEIRVHLLSLRRRPADKLLGVLSLRTLLLSLARRRSSTSSWTPTSSASHPDASADDVASMIARYDLLACPVVDDDGRMLGIVTVDDAIDAIIPETTAERQLPRFTRHRQAAEDDGGG